MSPTERDTIPVSEHGQLVDAVLDAAASLILVVDAEGRLVRWNRACDELLGYGQAELEAPFALLDLVPAAERQTAETAMRALFAGESPVHAEFHWRTRAGDLRLIEWSLTALSDRHGEITHMVGTGIDVTETRRWVEERVEGEARLRHIADHDALTGLFNRRRFEEELERHIAHGRRYGMSGALLLLDLDGFKRVNDTHGHRTGDRVLTAVAGVLRHRLRESDVIARFGGDEFAVLMPVGGARRARELAKLLASAVHTRRGNPRRPALRERGHRGPGRVQHSRRPALARRRRDVRREAHVAPGGAPPAVCGVAAERTTAARGGSCVTRVIRGHLHKPLDRWTSSPSPLPFADGGGRSARSLCPCALPSSSRTRVSPRGGRPRASWARAV